MLPGASAVRPDDGAASRMPMHRADEGDCVIAAVSDGSEYREALTTKMEDAIAAVEPLIFVIRLLRAAKWAVR